jgi:hypothetical protein
MKTNTITLSTNKSNNFIINQAINIILLLLIFSIPLSTSLTTILFSIFMLLWITEGNYPTKINCIWQYPACFATILLLIGLTIGSLYSCASWPEIINFLKKMVKLIYLPFLIFYFKNPNQRKLAINSLIISGITTSAAGLILDSYQPFKNSIDTSLTVTITIFLLLHKIDIKNKLYVNFSILLLSLFNVFYLFYISIGRTAQLICLLLIPLFFIQKIRDFNLNNNKYLIIIPTSLIILLLLFCGFFSKPLHHHWKEVIIKYQEYQANPINYSSNSISYRLTFFKNTLALIKQKPWLGWGTGSFIPVYKQFAEKNNTLLTTNPHNEYLLWGAQLGIVGISLLLWWFYILFKTSFIVQQNYEKYILQGTILTIFVGCFSNSWIMDFMPGYLFIILIAVSLGALPDVRTKTII